MGSSNARHGIGGGRDALPTGHGQVKREIILAGLAQLQNEQRICAVFIRFVVKVLEQIGQPEGVRPADAADCAEVCAVIEEPVAAFVSFSSTNVTTYSRGNPVRPLISSKGKQRPLHRNLGTASEPRDARWHRDVWRRPVVEPIPAPPPPPPPRRRRTRTARSRSAPTATGSSHSSSSTKPPPTQQRTGINHHNPHARRCSGEQSDDAFEDNRRRRPRARSTDHHHRQHLDTLARHPTSSLAAESSPRTGLAVGNVRRAPSPRAGPTAPKPLRRRRRHPPPTPTTPDPPPAAVRARRITTSPAISLTNRSRVTAPEIPSPPPTPPPPANL